MPELDDAKDPWLLRWEREGEEEALAALGIKGEGEEVEEPSLDPKGLLLRRLSTDSWD